VTRVYDLDKTNRRFAGTSAKPSDGLEPSTPSLPSSDEKGTVGKAGKPRAQKPRKMQKPLKGE
jgi:hypothetical protein